MSGVRELHVCPTCKGAGSVVGALPHEHEWRLVSSMTGETFNLQRWACVVEDCDAALCSDCLADGLQTCAAQEGKA